MKYPAALGITQKSAWFMMHRIRLAMQSGSLMKIGGSGIEVEVDETFIGGKARNMHVDKRERRIILVQITVLENEADRGFDSLHTRPPIHAASTKYPPDGACL